MVEERVLFEAKDARVTSTRAVFGTTTYPMQGITSVAIKAHTPPRSAAPFVLAMFGLMAMMFGGFMGLAVLGAIEKGDGDGVVTVAPVALAGLVGGLALVLLGVGAGRGKPPRTRYTVIVGTSGGDRPGLWTLDKDHAEAVKASIEKALVARG